MRKFLFIFTVCILLTNLYVSAQEKVFVPYLRFRLDDNVTDQYFLHNAAQFSGEHRFADGNDRLQYRFDLDAFRAVNEEHPLFLRAEVSNEYLILSSDYEIFEPDEGDFVAEYTDDPGYPPLRDGTNKNWVEVPLQQYFDMGSSEVFLTFFDARPQDGWGPSVTYIEFAYEEDPENIPDAGVDAVIGESDLIVPDGDFDDWDAGTEWVEVNSNADGVLTDGTIDSDSDLSASVAVAFDEYALYFGAEVVDDNVSLSDSLIFYFGSYDVGEYVSHAGHLAMPIYALTGYRARREADFRFAVSIDEDGAQISESKIIKGMPTGSDVSVVKTAVGYKVEARIPYEALYIDGITTKTFTIDPEQYLPFAYQIKDFDAADEGALITGSAADMDDNPVSWGFKTAFIDARPADEEIAKGVLVEFRANADENDYPGHRGLEERYLIPDLAANSSQSNVRFADGNDVLGYKFNLAELEAMAPGQEIFVEFTVWNEYLVNISGALDGEKTEVARWSTTDAPARDNSNTTDVTISCQQARDLGWNELYVFFTDGRPQDGWGPGVTWGRIYFQGVNESTSIIEFVPNNEGEELNYLVPGYEGSGVDFSHRWADGSSTIAYKFTIADIVAAIPSGAEPFFSVWMGNEFIMEISNSLEGQRTEIARWDEKGGPTRDMSNADWYQVSLQSFVDAGSENVYVFFSDGRPADGWGPSLHHVKIFFQEVMAVVEYQKFVCNNSGDELNFLVPGYEGSGVDDAHRWADAASVIAYKFNMADLASLSNNNKKLKLQFYVGNEYVVSGAAAIDGEKTELLTWDSKGRAVHDMSNAGIKTVDLDAFMDLEEFYLFFEDGIPEDGWGPALSWISINGLEKLKTGVEDNFPETVNEYALYQNYPNPFNPATQISYTLPDNGQVSLVVYNFLGQKVKTLVNSSQQLGRHTIVWNGTNDAEQRVASGLYFYQLNFDSQVKTKRMILVR